MTNTQRRALAGTRRGGAGAAARTYPVPHLRNLVLVACHSVYTGLDFHNTEEKSSWYLLDYQKVGAWSTCATAGCLMGTQHACKPPCYCLHHTAPGLVWLQEVPGQTHSFVEHVQLGIKEAAADKDALLLFSGGKTRRCGDANLNLDAHSGIAGNAASNGMLQGCGASRGGRGLLASGRGSKVVWQCGGSAASIHRGKAPPARPHWHPQPLHCSDARLSPHHPTSACRTVPETRLRTCCLGCAASTSSQGITQSLLWWWGMISSSAASLTSTEQRCGCRRRASDTRAPPRSTLQRCRCAGPAGRHA